MDFSLLDDVTQGYPQTQNDQNHLALEALDATYDQGSSRSASPYADPKHLGWNLYSNPASSSGSNYPDIRDEASADAFIDHCLNEGRRSFNDTRSEFGGSDLGLPTFNVTHYGDTLQPRTPSYHDSIDASPTSSTDCASPSTTSDNSKSTKGNRHRHGSRRPETAGAMPRSGTIEINKARLEDLRRIPVADRTRKQAKQIRLIADMLTSSAGCMIEDRLSSQTFRERKKKDDDDLRRRFQELTARCERYEKALSDRATLKSENDMLRAQLSQMTLNAHSLQGQVSIDSQSINPPQSVGLDYEMLLFQEREKSRRLVQLNQFILNNLNSDVITNLHELSNRTSQELEQVLNERGQTTFTQDVARRLLADQRTRGTKG